MSVLQRLAGRLFHHAGPCLGDVDAGEGSRHRSQDDPEAFVSSEWLGSESMLADVEPDVGQRRLVIGWDSGRRSRTRG
ncbi:protein kinase, cAMP-dependent, catalytic, alpha, genome duplicate a isoform X1 [Tachysurus ichikawai]